MVIKWWFCSKWSHYLHQLKPTTFLSFEYSITWLLLFTIRLKRFLLLFWSLTDIFLSFGKNTLQVQVQVPPFIKTSVHLQNSLFKNSLYKFSIPGKTAHFKLRTCCASGALQFCIAVLFYFDKVKAFCHSYLQSKNQRRPRFRQIKCLNSEFDCIVPGVN